MPLCPICGFDPSSVSPADAIVALRSFPRRFRELADDDELRAAALAEAGEAAEAIAVLHDDLRAVLVRDDPPVSTTPEVATAVNHGGEPTTALDRLTAASGALADLAAGTDADSWTRRGVRVDGPVKALDLLRDAVHAGAHHLRIARPDD